MKNIISKNAINGLVDQFILDENDEKEFKITEINPSKLIHSNRLDLGFKLFYLKFRTKCNNLAKEVYIDHIKSFSFGRFTEKGNINKNNPEDFLDNFEKIIINFKNYGFNEKISLIPVNTEKVILNGSHRIATAIFLGKKIKAVELKSDILNYDYKFFLKRNINICNLENSIRYFCDYSNRSRLAIIWPSSSLARKEINYYFKNIIYEKEYKFTDIGKHNFVTEIYKNEKWLGNYKNDFSGAKNKMYECFKTNAPVKIVIFNTDEKLSTHNLKSKIRDDIGIGKHSVHISDNNNFQNILDILFNENAFTLLNAIKKSKLYKEYNLTNKLKKIFLKYNIETNDIIIVGSFPLSLFQIRKNKDIDIVSISKNAFKFKNHDEIKISNHNDYLNLYGYAKEELIFDNRNYFLFNNLKILKLEILQKFKKNRNENKDKIDNLLINKYFKLQRNKINIKFYIIKISYFYEFLRYRIILFLIKVKLYKIIKTIFKK